MDILDSREEIKKLDQSNMISSVESLAEQCQHAWEDTAKINVPANYNSAKNIAVFAMGGSALGADVLRALWGESLKIPLHIINDYSIPAWVDNSTLAILSSYSGSTEETVSAAEKIAERTSMILAITTGSKLKQITDENQWPTYMINPVYNPCGQPRMAIGYSIIGQIGLLNKAGVLGIAEEEIGAIASSIRIMAEKCSVENTENNPAKEIARALKGKIPLLIGSEFISGVLHVMNNQINENAKNFSMYTFIPELNHHMMEGLGNPQEASKIFVPIFFSSSLYHPRNQIRYDITQEVMEKNGIKPVIYKLQADSKIGQAFELLSLGGHVAFYLSMLNGLNPSPIQWVDYFKRKMTK